MPVSALPAARRPLRASRGRGRRSCGSGGRADRRAARSRSCRARSPRPPSTKSIGLPSSSDRSWTRRRKRPNSEPIGTMRVPIVVSRRLAVRRSISSATATRVGSWPAIGELAQPRLRDDELADPVHQLVEPLGRRPAASSWPLAWLALCASRALVVGGLGRLGGRALPRDDRALPRRAGRRRQLRRHRPPPPARRRAPRRRPRRARRRSSGAIDSSMSSRRKRKTSSIASRATRPRRATSQAR